MAQLRIGYDKLNDYLQKIGVSETRTCKCGESETIEHSLLHCEVYFNEHEAMRTTLFQQTGITELTIDLLLGCDDSDLKKEFGMTITLVWVILSHRRPDYKFAPRPPQTINTGRYILIKLPRDLITDETLLSFRQRIQKSKKRWSN